MYWRKERLCRNRKPVTWRETKRYKEKADQAARESVKSVSVI